MLNVNYDRTYDRQRNQELAVFARVRKLEEQVSFWKGFALWCAALLFVVVCFVVGIGWS